MELNLRETELCLGLPGGGGDTTAATVVGNKRGYSETVDLKLHLNNEPHINGVSIDKTSPKELGKPPSKAQVVGWPPVRSYRKNVMVTSHKPNGGSASTTAEGEKAATLVKVSMDGAPYLRKVELKMYKSYKDLSNALATMFGSFTIRNNNTGGELIKESLEYVPSYEDKDGDWMLVGDVPWEMFVDSCKRIRIMKGSEAIAPRAMECESRV